LNELNDLKKDSFILIDEFKKESHERNFFFKLMFYSKNDLYAQMY